MSLIISYVERLEDVVQPAVEFLSRERDLFAKPRIVVAMSFAATSRPTVTTSGRSSRPA